MRRSGGGVSWIEDSITVKRITISLALQMTVKNGGSYMRPSITTNCPPLTIEATIVCWVFDNPVCDHSTEYATVSAVPEAATWLGSTRDTVTGN
jgi:hypothetical protein